MLKGLSHQTQMCLYLISSLYTWAFSDFNQHGDYNKDYKLKNVFETLPYDKKRISLKKVRKYCAVLLSTDNSSSSAISVFITHAQSSWDSNQLSILLKHLVRMGTSGAEIQLSRTSCLLINIPSNGSCIKVSLLFHQLFPCGPFSCPSLVEKQWKQESWATEIGCTWGSAEIHQHHGKHHLTSAITKTHEETFKEICLYCSHRTRMERRIDLLS